VASQWEETDTKNVLNEDHHPVSTYSDRLEVPGGWIVRTIVNIYNSGVSVHQVFVPDPEHLWELKK